MISRSRRRSELQTAVSTLWFWYLSNWHLAVVHRDMRSEYTTVVTRSCLGAVALKPVVISKKIQLSKRHFPGCFSWTDHNCSLWGGTISFGATHKSNTCSDYWQLPRNLRVAAIKDSYIFEAPLHLIVVLGQMKVYDLCCTLFFTASHKLTTCSQEPERYTWLNTG